MALQPSTSAAALAALALLACSCVAAGAGGLVPAVDAVEQQGAPVVDYEYDARRVWGHVKETLAHLSERQLRLDEEALVAVATEVHDGVVEVQVEALGPGRSRMKVTGRLYSSPSDELALQVLDQIDRQIEPRRADL